MPEVVLDSSHIKATKNLYEPCPQRGSTKGQHHSIRHYIIKIVLRTMKERYIKRSKPMVGILILSVEI